MTRTLLALALGSILAAGCARTAAPTKTANEATAVSPEAAASAAESAADAAASEAAKASETSGKAGAEPAKAARPAPWRVPGDYVVHRFSGAYRDAPVTLTQRVVAREGDALVVDLTFEERGKKDRLRVRMNDAAGARGEVLAVSRIDDAGVEHPAGATAETALGVYEKMMARTTLLADENEATLESEDVTVEVGGKPLAARSTSYKIRVGDKQAVLRSIESDEFIWGDVRAEIVAQGGVLLYKAEVVEVGHAAPPAAAAVARTDDEADDGDDTYE